MKRTLSLASFRRLDRAEEALIRAVMPRTAAADPEPLTPFAGTPARRTWTLAIAPPLMVSLAEVAHA